MKNTTRNRAKQSLKNITTIAKYYDHRKYYTRKNNNEEDNSNCLTVFFGIIHLDDMLSSPGIRTSKKARLVCGGESLFFGS